MLLKYKAEPKSSALYFILLLFRLGSVDRAGICASAAIKTSIGIDNVLAVTLADRAHRAVAGAHAARDAVIRNLISHTFHLPLLRITPEEYFSTKAREMQGFCEKLRF